MSHYRNTSQSKPFLLKQGHNLCKSTILTLKLSWLKSRTQEGSVLLKSGPAQKIAWLDRGSTTEMTKKINTENMFRKN